MCMKNKKVVIVGGGKIAYRKAKGFDQTGAKVLVIAPEIIEELTLLPFVECKQKSFERNDLDGAHLIFAATDNKEINEFVVSSASSQQWVNNVSDGKAGSFMTPAIVRRGDLVLTASTTGNSPVLAKEIKKQWEKQFDERYEQVVEEYRQKRKKTTD
ncbi:MAG: bifunctional precorrin-2 dehydrogenase/sirohydrochlorin ferrochelatase [Bacillus sp. (in: firmicutes)]